MIELRNALWFDSCLCTFFCQFGTFWFNTVKRMLADGYFGTSGNMLTDSHTLSFKSRVSIEQCIAKDSIRIDCPTASTLFWFYFIRHSLFESMYLLFDNSRVFFFFSSDGKLWKSQQPAYCNVRWIHNNL